MRWSRFWRKTAPNFGIVHMNIRSVSGDRFGADSLNDSNTIAHDYMNGEFEILRMGIEAFWSLLIDDATL